MGTVLQVAQDADSGSLTIGASKVLTDIALGDSIAVNGVCLTVTAFTGGQFVVDVMPVTFQKTNLGKLAPGHKVNLERALKFNSRLGGHLVSGHVDSPGTITGIVRDQNALRFQIEAPESIRKLFITAGSVALDGISLTVAEITPSGFIVSIIPHTASNTTLTAKRIGDLVNIEADLVGKYLYHFMHMKEGTGGGSSRLFEASGSGSGGERPGLSREFLATNGFLS